MNSSCLFHSERDLIPAKAKKPKSFLLPFRRLFYRFFVHVVGDHVHMAFSNSNFFLIPKYVCINSKIPINFPIHVYYMLWKFQVIWGSRKKVFFISNFYDPEISSPAKNGMSLTAPYSEISSAIYNLFLSEILQYMGNTFKKSLNVYDAWFGFYGDFKKGTFGLPYEHGRTKWVKNKIVMSLTRYIQKTEKTYYCQSWIVFFHSQTLAAWGGLNTSVGIDKAKTCWTPFSWHIYYCHL